MRRAPGRRQLGLCRSVRKAEGFPGASRRSHLQAAREKGARRPQQACVSVVIAEAPPSLLSALQEVSAGPRWEAGPGGFQSVSPELSVDASWQEPQHLSNELEGPSLDQQGSSGLHWRFLPKAHWLCLASFS